MAKHPNVQRIDDMTSAAVAGDSDALNQLFTPDVYRFENDRIAEMWFICAGTPDQVAFWD